MNKIEKIKDFKRAMIVGSKWEAFHKYIGEHPSEQKSLGIRECVLSNSVEFGFMNEIVISHCKWPTKEEFSTEDDGNVVVITKPGFCQLRYIEMN